MSDDLGLLNLHSLLSLLLVLPVHAVSEFDHFHKLAKEEEEKKNGPNCLKLQHSKKIISEVSVQKET